LAHVARAWSAADFTGVTAPTSLDKTSVTIGGKSAFIDYVSAGQINALVSSDTPIGTQPLTVTTPGGTSAPYSITVNPTQPGLLAPPSFKIAGQQYAVAIFPDGTFALRSGAIPGVASRPAKPGDVLTLYGVGFGPVIPDNPAGQLVQGLNALALPFQMFLQGTPVPAAYDGLAPGFTGLYQFNVTVPPLAPGDAALTFTLGGTPGTQNLYIPITN